MRNSDEGQDGFDVGYVGLDQLRSCVVESIGHVLPCDTAPIFPLFKRLGVSQKTLSVTLGLSDRTLSDWVVRPIPPKHLPRLLALLCWAAAPALHEVEEKFDRSSPEYERVWQICDEVDELVSRFLRHPRLAEQIQREWHAIEAHLRAAFATARVVARKTEASH